MEEEASLNCLTVDLASSPNLPEPPSHSPQCSGKRSGTPRWGCLPGTPSPGPVRNLGTVGFARCSFWMSSNHVCLLTGPERVVPDVPNAGGSAGSPEPGPAAPQAWWLTTVRPPKAKDASLEGSGLGVYAVRLCAVSLAVPGRIVPGSPPPTGPRPPAPATPHPGRPDRPSGAV